MKIFNRDPSVVLKAPVYLWYFIKCLFVFKRPLSFIYAYCTLKPLPGQLVELRSGLKVYLSDFGHDVITVFVIFIKKDYGSFPNDKTVVDIGANIGVFALYAVHVLKAKRVLAYEPHPGSFACLQKNISANSLQGRIVAYELAVSDRPGQVVNLTIGAGPYNTIFSEDHPEMASVYGQSKAVQTTSLVEIMRDAGNIDIMKLDCEGSEYDILFSSSSQLLAKIGEIRMEYHKGRVAEVSDFLKDHGFSETFNSPYTDTVGNLWFARLSQPAYSS